MMGLSPHRVHSTSTTRPRGWQARQWRPSVTAPGVSAELVAAGPVFSAVQEWDEGFLAPTIVRCSSNDFVWCPRWWAYAEVVSRLTGLWITWEQARAGSPADINTWWLQQIDPHLAVITAHGGPLNG